MGLHMNPSTEDYLGMTSEKTFVDHTEMLEIISKKINRQAEKYMAVSRPRRFGKTVDARMLAAFFEKGANESQFKGLKIADYEETCREHCGKYNVIFIGMSNNMNEKTDIVIFLENMKNLIMLELKKAFPDIDLSPFIHLSDALGTIYATTRIEKENSTAKGTSFIFIVDEWDAPLRLMKNDENGQKYYISWLNSLFKGKNYLALAYMTGILPIKKYGDDSFMNMFDEYSMLEPTVLAPYMGFIEKEVEMLCGRYQEDIDEYKAWYDGYLMTKSKKSKSGKLCNDGIRREFTKIHVYNPRAIAKAFSEGNILDYWDRTGMFESLKSLIDTNLLGLRTSILEMMNGEKKVVDTKVYKNNLSSLTSINQVFTLLVHLGYLTYDAESEEVYIPNRELMEEFARATREDSQEYSLLKKMLSDSMGLLQDTWDMKPGKVAQAIEKAHMLVCSPKDYNNELALSIAVTFAYYAANEYFTIYPEAPAGIGYANIIFIPVEPSHPAMVVELKWNKNVETAINQIKAKKYTDRLSHYAGNILCVGISYEKTDANDPAYKKHTCIIERL